MNKVKNRTLIALVLILLLTVGIAFYVGTYVRDGASWASFSANRSVYTGGKLTRGQIVDRNGTILLQNTADGKVYHADPAIRTATLHVTGDRNGNIGTSVARKYASILSGFDLINGIYTLSGTGTTLALTLDAQLCADAYAALAGRRGSILVYNYKTGEILCMVSAPSFDPDNMPQDLDTNAQYSGAYINRCISSTFTPGSIFKLITTACAIDTLDDLFDREFYCEGSYVIDGKSVNCQGVHGTIKIGDALAKSCNCAFAQLSQLLGNKAIASYAERFGLTETLDIGEITAAAGSYDISDDAFELAWSGIGQSTDLVNPMAMLRAMGAIANGGVAVAPRLVRSESSADNRMLSAQTADTLRQMMAYNVSSNYGSANYPGLSLCAKSGTAEVGGDTAPHAWFVGFLENAEAPLAFVVFIENGGSGSVNAGALANTVLQSALRHLTEK